MTFTPDNCPMCKHRLEEGLPRCSMHRVEVTKCNEAWDTSYPCDLPKGHDGEHHNEYARS
jgi:hypothetical protein